MVPIELSKWISENVPGENMLCRAAAANQAKLFTELAASAKRATVVSTHRSKSINLPVVLFEYENGATVQIRENFYNYKATVRAPHPVALPEGVHGDEEIHDCYCEGFPRGTVLGTHAADPRNFTVEFCNDSQLRTLLDNVRAQEPVRSALPPGSHGVTMRVLSVDPPVALLEFEPSGVLGEDVHPEHDELMTLIVGSVDVVGDLWGRRPIACDARRSLCVDAGFSHELRSGGSGALLLVAMVRRKPSGAGSGLDAEDHGHVPATCRSCRGVGRLRETEDDGRRRASDAWRKCLDCNGAGHVSATTTGAGHDPGHHPRL